MNRNGNKKRILVVDDDPQRAENMAHVLVRHGCRVALATTLAEALEQLANEPFDAVVSQLDMRDTTGWILVARVRQQHPRLPVILATASYSDGKWASALVWGAHALVRTPLRDTELSAALASVAHKEAVPAGHATEAALVTAGR